MGCAEVEEIGNRKGRPLNSKRHRIHRVNVPRFDRQKSFPPLKPRHASMLDPLEEVYRALVLGVRDYVRKNRFKKVLIGMSGGVDSALTAVIAMDAIGASNVVGVFMPSPYTSKESREDAMKLAKELRIELLTLSISGLFRSYLRLLEKTFKGMPRNTTEENIQARIRGNLLMALSNKFGHLVLTTGK